MSDQPEGTSLLGGRPFERCAVLPARHQPREGLLWRRHHWSLLECTSRGEGDIWLQHGMGRLLRKASQERWALDRAIDKTLIYVQDVFVNARCARPRTVRSGRSLA